MMRRLCLVALTLAGVRLGAEEAPPATLAAPAQVPPSSAAARPATADAPAVRPSDNPELRLNFTDAPLDTVLDYLSRAAGFVIVRDSAITGTVSIVSHNPLSADEAVGLLHAVLNDRGYAVIRTDRTLRIVRRDEARTRDIPVYTGSESAGVPKTSEVVTQIVPLRHTSAAKLIETLKPLVPAQGSILANEDSNALVITDTRTAIRRLLEVIEALDSAVASILDIQVISLRYADAAETADVINKVYETPAAKSGSQSSRGGRQDFFARMRSMGPPGGPGEDSGGSSDSSSEARQTASYVKAVADARGNAVVVTAPSQALVQIAELVAELDQPTEAVTTLRVFPLRFAKASDIATAIATLYPDSTTSSRTSASRGAFGRMGFPPMMGPPEMMMQGQGQTQTPSQGGRKLSETKVVAVADTRTNSVIVSASSTTMADIDQVIKELDATPANVPTVFVYQLQNGDVRRAKEILESMFGDLEGSGTGSTTGRSTSSSRTSSSRTTGGTGGTGGTPGAMGSSTSMGR